MNIESASYLRAVSMSKPAFVKEHKHLVKVLKQGSKQEQQKEASDQAKELEEVTGGGPGSGRHPGFGAHKTYSDRAVFKKSAEKSFSHLPLKGTVHVHPYSDGVHTVSFSRFEDKAKIQQHLKDQGYDCGNVSRVIGNRMRFKKS